MSSSNAYALGLQGQIYEMYSDDSTAFGNHIFMEFRQLCEWHHEQIQLVWDVDINESEEVLAFAIGDKRIHARHFDQPVTKERWGGIVANVKSECQGELICDLSSYCRCCSISFSIGYGSLVCCLACPWIAYVLDTLLMVGSNFVLLCRSCVTIVGRT
jgi:hypothetical protein